MKRASETPIYRCYHADTLHAPFSNPESLVLPVEPNLLIAAGVFLATASDATAMPRNAAAAGGFRGKSVKRAQTGPATTHTPTATLDGTASGSLLVSHAKKKKKLLSKPKVTAPKRQVRLCLSHDIKNATSQLPLPTIAIVTHPRQHLCIRVNFGCLSQVT